MVRYYAAHDTDTEKSFFFIEWLFLDLITGIVHILAPQADSGWSEVATLSSPIADIGNFGTAVHMDEADDSIIIGANAYSKCIPAFLLHRLLQFMLMNTSIAFIS